MTGGLAMDPSSTHTLINLPPPPSDPVTPSDIPGTPTSTTTSMSELSTVAIKDGHRGHLQHKHQPMDAERADRISRLAGLDRMAQPLRMTAGSAGGTPSLQQQQQLQLQLQQTQAQAQMGLGSGGVGPGGGGGGVGGGGVTGSGGAVGGFGFQGAATAATTAGAAAAAAAAAAGGMSTLPQGYFDANNTPQIMRERSTVGSASATGSVGGRTTWASGSDVYDLDKMSEDMDVDNSSVGGFSDEAQSLVGFGEGARTPAGKVTAAVPQQQQQQQQQQASLSSYLRDGSAMAPSPLSAHSGSVSADGPRQDVRMIDGMTYDTDFVDAASRTPPSVDEEAETEGVQGGRRLRTRQQYAAAAAAAAARDLDMDRDA